MIQAYIIIFSYEIIEQILIINIRNLIFMNQKYEDISLFIFNKIELYNIMINK